MTARDGCLDIDECQNPLICGSNAVCINIPGSFVCECGPGFTGNPKTQCEGNENITISLLALFCFDYLKL